MDALIPHYQVNRMSAESGPLSSWVEAMAFETRQFMALSAMNEALFIARCFTMDYFICQATGMEKNGEQARAAALSVFAPLFDEVDNQMNRRKVHQKMIGNVIIPDVPSFGTENQTPEEGLVGWLRTIRVRKEVLWNDIFKSRREHAEATWTSAMRFMSARIDKVVRLVIVMLHKNIRGFPETEWMRRYAAFGGGTRSSGISRAGISWLKTWKTGIRLWEARGPTWRT